MKEALQASVTFCQSARSPQQQQEEEEEEEGAGCALVLPANFGHQPKRDDRERCAK